MKGVSGSYFSFDEVTVDMAMKPFVESTCGFA